MEPKVYRVESCGANLANGLRLLVCHMVKGVVCLAVGKESFFLMSSGYQQLPMVTSGYREVTERSPKFEIRNKSETRRQKI